MGIIRTLAVPYWPASRDRQPVRQPHLDHSCNKTITYEHTKNPKLHSTLHYNILITRHWFILRMGMALKGFPVVKWTRGALRERSPCWIGGAIRARAKFSSLLPGYADFHCLKLLIIINKNIFTMYTLLGVPRDREGSEKFKTYERGY